MMNRQTSVKINTIILGMILPGWMGGLFRKEGTGADLESMARSGIGGVMVMQMPGKGLKKLVSRDTLVTGPGPIEMIVPKSPPLPGKLLWD
jgi:hypothetical protein